MCLERHYEHHHPSPSTLPTPPPHPPPPPRPLLFRSEALSFSQNCIASYLRARSRFHPGSTVPDVRVRVKCFATSIAGCLSQNISSIIVRSTFLLPSPQHYRYQPIKSEHSHMTVKFQVPVFYYSHDSSKTGDRYRLTPCFQTTPCLCSKTYVTYLYILK